MASTTSLADADSRSGSAATAIHADELAESEVLLARYLDAVRRFAPPGVEPDVAPAHSSRAHGFAASRAGDAGPAVVYLPGLHSDALPFWRLHGESWSGFQLYGVRWSLLGDIDPARYGRDVVELLDHAGVERAHLIGESMGSIPAQWIAANHPERVASVTLAGGFALTPGWWRVGLMRAIIGATPNWGLRLALRMAGTMASLVWASRDGLTKEFIRSYADLRRPQHIRAMRRRLAMIHAWDFDAELPRIAAPLLYAYGTRDMTVRLGRESKRYRERVAGAEIAPMPKVGHPILIERPAASRELAQEFIRRVEESAPRS